MVMSTSKILIAGLVTGVVAFFLGWLFYGILLMDFFESNAGGATGVSRGDSMIWWALIAGNLIWGIFFAYIFGKWASISTAATGASAGAILGLLVGAGLGLIYYGTSDIMNLMGTVVDIAVSVVSGAILGAVAGWMLGR
jgi:hypothetical protein